VGSGGEGVFSCNRDSGRERGGRDTYLNNPSWFLLYPAFVGKKERGKRDTRKRPQTPSGDRGKRKGKKKSAMVKESRFEDDVEKSVEEWAKRRSGNGRKESH